MTRCIQCTRCVRFLKEVAGLKELGLINRGEHAEVTAYVDRSVDSELSGNIIDLCPVGALTSKPFRYSARSWELTRRPSISPHDSLGSNIEVHVKNNRVLRVVSREQDDINECWLSDRDRFSYEGLYSEDRLTQPMVKQGGEWRTCDWKTALEYAANGLADVTHKHGAEQLGALAAANSTLEELHLLQKLVRGLGGDNIDHRLRQRDFRADGAYIGVPWLGCKVTDLEKFDRVLVIGSNMRKEHPLVAQRLRKAVRKGAELSLVSPLDEDSFTTAKYKAICTPQDMVNVLSQLLKAMSGLQNAAMHPAARQRSINVEANIQAMAESLAGYSTNVCLVNYKVGVFLGDIALHHPRYAELYSLAESIAALTGASFGVLGDAANTIGGHLVGAMPQKGGMNAQQMVESPRKAYILMGMEPELDCHNPQITQSALKQAALVVALSAYKGSLQNYADVLLPIAPFTETSGTYVNMEGRAQSFAAVTQPLGETRPGWKVLRVLGNILKLDGFGQDSSDQVRDEIGQGRDVTAWAQGKLNCQLSRRCEVSDEAKVEGLQRIGDVPPYQADSIVRRSVPLQKTKDAATPGAAMCAGQMAQLGAQEGDELIVRQGDGSARLKARRDDSVPDGCVRVGSALAETAMLGDMFGEITVGRA